MVARIFRAWRAGAIFFVTTRKLAKDIGRLADNAGIPVQIGQSGTIFGLYFLKESGAEITDASSAKLYADSERYSRFFHLMLEQGVYFAPSQFEVAFVSAAHGESQVEATLRAVEVGFRELAGN
jgi:glutamate-1-semialdehyde 2,1-aminomutase